MDNNGLLGYQWKRNLKTTRRETVQAVRRLAGSFAVYFGSKELCGDVPNRLDVTEGWNFLMRIYRPGASVLDGTYVLPAVQPKS